MKIHTNTIKSDGKTTVFSNSLEVSFQNPEDATAFQEMISELGIEDSAKDQLYLLESMCYAGVSYEVS